MKNALYLIGVICLFLLVALWVDTVLRPRVPLKRILGPRVLALTTVEEASSIQREIKTFPRPPYFSTALVFAILALSIVAIRKADKEKPPSN
jgi:hypothetical protein